MTDSHITLVHISDLHIPGKWANTSFDLDSDLRSQLINDLTAQRSDIGDVDGILVTGDIAFKGAKEEFDYAGEWLAHLTEVAGCDETSVWMCPGNHDVDRSCHNDPVILDAHKRLRACSGHMQNQTLAEYISSPLGSEALFRPLENYNQFASRYQCATRPAQPSWTQDLSLNDGSTLRLTGINSALVSDASDSAGDNKLFVGNHQLLPLEDKPGLQHLTLCHHPPDWLLDQDDIEDKLVRRAHIQLFGHKHRQRPIQFNDSSVRLVSGALHPPRTEEPWSPGYNILRVRVGNDTDTRELHVEIRERLWSGEFQRFVPGPTESGAGYRSYRIALPPWTPSTPAASSPSFDGPMVTTDAPDVASEGTNTVTPERHLTYRFLTLSFRRQMRIAVDLELLDDEDHGLEERDLFPRIFKRAKEREKIAYLWDAVEAAHGDSGTQSNPWLEK